MAFLYDIVFDCHHPAVLARFWAAALEGYEVAPYDEAERARLRALGIDDVEDDPTVLVQGPTLPRYFFQRVPEGKAVKNRMHLDIEVPEIETEVSRLVELGATRLQAGTCEEHGSTWIPMADPEGNEFCAFD